MYTIVKKLSNIGERKIIQFISKILSNGKVAVGIGDDCAALEFGDKYLLVSTDMISRQTHMPKNMNPWQIGWFIVAVNLSDIAAKGGRPEGLLLSLGLPGEITDVYLEKLIEGANKCAVTYHTSIIGGDTKENPDVTLCGTAFGIVDKNKFMPRKGANPGDIVAVTGNLGKAGAGYYAYEHKIEDKELLKGLLEPIPKLWEGMALAEEKIVTSCMDISDGLSSSLYQLREINHLGFELDKEKIPLSPILLKLSEENKKLDVYKYGIHFGGDYELLLTLSLDTFEPAQKIINKIGGELTNIGKVTKKKEINIVDKGVKRVLPNKGYEHFKKSYF